MPWTGRSIDALSAFVNRKTTSTVTPLTAVELLFVNCPSRLIAPPVAASLMRNPLMDSKLPPGCPDFAAPIWGVVPLGARGMKYKIAPSSKTAVTIARITPGVELLGGSAR